MHRRRGLIQIHAAALLAGFTALFGKLLTVDAITITAERTVFGGAVLALVVTASGGSLRVRGVRDFALIALSGVVLAAHWICFFRAVQVSTVAVGLLAFSSFPLFVTFLEPLVFGEKLRRREIFCALIVVAGLVLVTPDFDPGNHLTQGVLWGIGAAITCAVLSTLSRSLVSKHPPMTVAFYQQIFAALAALPFVPDWHAAVEPRTLLPLVLLGVVFTALLQSLILAGLRYVRAQTVSVIFGLEPVYGIVFALALLGEKPAARTLLGGALICGAVAWASWRSEPHAAHA